MGTWGVEHYNESAETVLELIKRGELPPPGEYDRYIVYKNNSILEMPKKAWDIIKDNKVVRKKIAEKKIAIDDFVIGSWFFEGVRIEFNF